MTPRDGGGDAQPDAQPDVVDPCAPSRPSAQEVSARVQALKDVIKAGILTTDPMAVSKLFNSNVDWHSSVHAHWALLQLARLTSDRALEDFLAARLTDAALDAERQQLASSMYANFEIPYGQSWLLMMLTELAKHRSSPVISALHQETEQRVFAFLDARPFPEGKYTILGDHSSWLFSYLMIMMSDTVAPDARAHLAQLRAAKVEPARDKIPSMMAGSYDFLYIPAILAVLDRVDPNVTTFPDYPVDALYPLMSPIDLSNAHTAGQAMTRVWPFAIESRVPDAAACERYYGRMTEMFMRTDQWKDNFQNVSHWVPQFMWMGMWLERGRP